MKRKKKHEKKKTKYLEVGSEKMKKEKYIEEKKNGKQPHIKKKERK